MNALITFTFQSFLRTVKMLAKLSSQAPT